MLSRPAVFTLAIVGNAAFSNDAASNEDDYDGDNQDCGDEKGVVEVPPGGDNVGGGGGADGRRYGFGHVY